MDKLPEVAAAGFEVEAEVQHRLGEVFALTLTYRCMKDVWLDKVESYSGQNGRMEQRQR